MAVVCAHYVAGGRRVVVVVVGTSRILIGPHSPAPSIPSDLCQVVVSPLAGNSTGMSLHLPRARGNFRVTNIFCAANPFCSAKTESVSGRSVPTCADAARPLTTHAWWFPWTLIFRRSADRRGPGPIYSFCSGLLVLISADRRKKLPKPKERHVT